MVSSVLLFSGLCLDINTTHKLLQRNGYPKQLLENITRAIFNKNYVSKEHPSKNHEIEKIEERYYKLPFIGNFSRISNARLQKICQKFCKDLKIHLVFVPHKIGSHFSTKDKLPPLSRSHVIYEYNCFSCNAKYIGLTTRRLGIRISEHLNTEKCSTAVAQHLKQSLQCKHACKPDCFKIIDVAHNETSLKIKEALHILEKGPNLNIQVKHDNLQLFM